MEDKELWSPIKYNPYIMISSKGRVKRLVSPNNKKEYIQESFSKDKDGYCKINIKKEEKGRYLQASIHRLVAEAFIPNPYNKTCVNHKDSNRQNNNMNNLEWVTPKENVLHSFQSGNRKKLKTVPRTTVLTDYQISQIDNLRSLYTIHQISKLYNIKYETLKNIIRKKKQSEKLDNQQPSSYNSIYITEGSTTIPQGSRT